MSEKKLAKIADVSKARQFLRILSRSPSTKGLLLALLALSEKAKPGWWPVDVTPFRGWQMGRLEFLELVQVLGPASRTRPAVVRLTRLGVLVAQLVREEQSVRMAP